MIDVTLLLVDSNTHQDHLGSGGAFAPGASGRSDPPNGIRVTAGLATDRRLPQELRNGSLLTRMRHQRLSVPAESTLD
jgi:hypothetical protein